MKRAALIALLLALATPAWAADVDPIDPVAAGLAAARAEKWAEAVPHLRRGLELDPNNATVAAELGYAL